MRKSQKKQVEDFAELLGRVHDEIKKRIKKKDRFMAAELLGQCQEGAVNLGRMIEQTEGTEVPAVSLLEDYCELVYQIYESLIKDQELDENKVHMELGNALLLFWNSIQKDIKVRFEIVFLPYKASMWDSMESVWRAAEQDPDCDAWVVPIPYYDREKDGLPGKYHYEGDQFPSDVPVTHFSAYSFEKRHPDAVYIHNPYDNANYVTTTAPEFYSGELKKHTECLVYIPYYSTSGGMSGDQEYCPAYENVDYIITQAEKYRKFFDASLPAEKFIPLGSPKFDQVLRKCGSPPKPPVEWKEKLKGKKVYFYNTSLGGMLSDTEHFLEKMAYVFHCFEGREEACLLWRPHPLMEATVHALRGEYKERYQVLRNEFIQNGTGIYDDTPDITDTIALSDVYIGDAGTSVTSLFGMAGKPLFILSNQICGAPGEEDWKGAVIRGFPVTSGIRNGVPGIEKDAWMLTQGNHLYRSEGGDGVFHHFCRLSEYAEGGFFGGPIYINGRVYLYPVNGNEILLIGEAGIRKRIRLEPCVERAGAFYSAAAVGNYLFLIPNQYPCLVRYDTEKDALSYLEINKNLFTGTAENGEYRCGAVGVKGRQLYLASPVSPHVLSVNAETGEWKLMKIPSTSGGYMGMESLPEDEDFWLLPFSGSTVVRWNPETGEAREYQAAPEGFICRHIYRGEECMSHPFGSAVFCKEHVYLSPCWGNQYVCLDKNTGEVTEWIPSIEQPEQVKNGYFVSWARGYLTALMEGSEIREYRLFSVYDRKLYRVDFESGECQEIEICFDEAELRRYEPGFQEQSRWLQYACMENAFNSLPDFLDGTITGNPFDKERQLLAYRRLTANSDGSSGERIHQFVCGKLRETGDSEP